MTHFHAAVWIDHHEAKVFRFNATDVEHVIVRPLDPGVHIHHKANTIGSGHAPVDQAFFRRVIDAVASAGAIMIVGPANAKTELASFIAAHDPALSAQIATVETVDHLTDGEVVAQARRYFQANDRLRRLGAIVVDKGDRSANSRFTRRRATLAFVAVTAAMLGLSARPSVAQTYATTGNIVTLTGQVTSRATVDAIDPDGRLGVFIVPDGHSLTLSIDEGVRNIRAMRHGEEVTITYSEVVTVHNLRHDSSAAREASRQPDLQSAPGREPEVSTFIVVGIDRAADRVGSVSRVSLVERQGGEVRIYAFSLHTSPEEIWRIAPGDVLRGVTTRLVVRAR